jgi:iron complex outermembrane receptor protein
MKEKDLVAQAVRLALVAGMAGVACISPADAQDGLPADEDVAVQELITVTGTRIKRSDAEGALPITVITREDIDQSGEISVADLLRTQTFNTFGSEKPGVSGDTNEIDMRGLGEKYTLILVNGRRTSFGNDLSPIPLAAVERIEVLRDGASAIYGTEAMAGVINIILRKDYSGFNLSYEIGRPDQSGGDNDSYSITGGVSSEKGNVTFGMEAWSQDIVHYRDRDFTPEQLPFQGLSADGFPASYFAYLGTEDPRNPTGASLSIGRFPDPRCPGELYSDPAYPWSGTVSTWDGAVCAYGWWGESAQEAAYDAKSFFVDASYEITDRLEFFASGLFTSNEISTVWAPIEVRDLYMSQSAPQNPTNPDNPTNYRGDAFGGQSVEVDTDGDGEPDTTIEGPFDVQLRYRNAPAGNRDRETRDTVIDYVAGVRGTVDWLGGADWELSAQWSENSSDYRSKGEVNVSSLQADIEAGTFDLYGVFGPYDDVVGAASRAALTESGDAKYRIAGGDGQIGFDAFRLDNGPVPVVLGFEYRDEDFEWDGADAGARVVRSVFAETAIPLLASLEVGVAGRHDDYNDFGTTTNPKLTVQFRPLDSLLLRSSYGTGFVAPDYDSLNISEGEWTGGAFIDSWLCSQTPEGDENGRAVVDPDVLPEGHPCRDEWRGEFNVWAAGNPDLQPEESDNWTVGLVWSPTASLSVVLDYFDIQINGQIWDEEMQPLLDDELALRQSGQTGATIGRVTREPSGRIERLYWTSENVDKTSTDGIDAEARISFGVGPVGDVSLGLAWTHVFHYKRDYKTGRGEQDWVGNVGYPQDRGQLTVNWNRGDYAATIVGNYISDQDGYRPWSDDDGEHLASFTTWDVQATYSTPWNGQITLGARNVFDRDPPLGNYGVVYEEGQHEIYGRVPYLRLEQDF